jgi:hypothetical protein
MCCSLGLWLVKFRGRGSVVRGRIVV